MSFQDDYQILKLVSDAEVICFCARQNSSGRSVLVHQIRPERNPPDQADLGALLDWVVRYAPPEITGHILECGQDGNRVFAVTEDVPECLNLRALLQAAADAYQPPADTGPAEGNSESSSAQPGTPSMPAGVAPDTGKEKRGEFTQWFAQAPLGIASPASPSLNEDEGAPPLPAPVPGPVEGPLPEPTPGSFTSMFLTPGKEAVPPSSPASSGPPAAPPANKPQPGEFTGMFFTEGHGSMQLASPHAPPVPNPQESATAKPQAASIRGQPPAGFEVVYRGKSRKTRPPTASLSVPANAGAETSGRATSGGGESGGMRTEAPPGNVEPALARAAPTPLDARIASGPAPNSGESTLLLSTNTQPAPAPPSPHTSQDLQSSLPPYAPAAPGLQISQTNSAAQKSPGEFTQFFQRGEGAGTQGAPATPAHLPRTFASGPSPSTQKEPGPVTRIIQGYRPPQVESMEQATPPAVPPSVRPVEPGGGAGSDYPAAFDGPLDGPAPTPPADFPRPYVQPAPPQPKPPPGPSEYTRIIMGAKRSASAPTEVPPPVPSGGPAAPGLPSSALPKPAASLPQVKAPQPPAFHPPPAPAMPPASAPGVAFPQPKASPPSTPPEVSPPGSEKRALWVSLIVLGCLFVVAAAVIVYFSIKH